MERSTREKILRKVKLVDYIQVEGQSGGSGKSGGQKTAQALFRHVLRPAESGSDQTFWVGLAQLADLTVLEWFWWVRAPSSACEWCVSGSNRPRNAPFSMQGSPRANMQTLAGGSRVGLR